MNHAHIAYGIPGIDEEEGERLRKHLQAVPGVHAVTVWLGEQQIDVDYDPDTISPATLADAIRRLDHLPEFIPRTKRWPE